MNQLSRITTFALSTAVLGLVIAGCQPQGGVPANQATESATAETMVAEAPAVVARDVIGGAGMHEMFAGNTILGVFDAWKLRWSEYFAPDGTAQALLRFEGQDDRATTGTYYTNNRDEFCTDYPELDEPNVFCSKMVPLENGMHQQVYADGTVGSIYEQILEGEQLHALGAVSDNNSQLMTVTEMRELLVGNTIMGTSHSWNMTWSEYFAPDGTTKVRFRFEGQDDVGEATGIHYFNSKGQLCTDPEGDLGPYCNWILPLGNGKYEQVYEQASDGETSGSIYEQVLEGDQVDAFK